MDVAGMHCRIERLGRAVSGRGRPGTGDPNTWTLGFLGLRELKMLVQHFDCRGDVSVTCFRRHSDSPSGFQVVDGAIGAVTSEQSILGQNMGILVTGQVSYHQLAVNQADHFSF
jgi:hypothetical protein